KSVTIQGFRGINEERTIDFHDELTLIYAPNSYGKTSISEALEWLLYGVTSKVNMAGYKDEFRGSYRNCHLAESATPFVKVKFFEVNTEIKYHGELTEEEDIKKFVNGQLVEAWPLDPDISKIPKPFILQHALKHLLLVKPDERFQGFAVVLGLEDLEKIQKNIVSLCTKPDAAIPIEAEKLFRIVNEIKSHLASQSSLKGIDRMFKKGIHTLDEVYEIIYNECKRRLPQNIEEESFLQQLLKIREDAVGKIFKGRLILFDYSDNEKQHNYVDKKFFSEFLTESFIEQYMSLITLSIEQYVLDRAQFFDLGIEFLKESPELCPFCGQFVNQVISQHICEEHKSFSDRRQNNIALDSQRAEIMQSISSLKQRIELHQRRNIDKVASLLAMESSLDQLKTILLPKYTSHFQAVESAISEIESASKKLEDAHSGIIRVLIDVKNTIAKSREDSELIRSFGEAIIEYIKDTHTFTQTLSKNVSALSQADQILKGELDVLAGTEDISVLIDLIQQRKYIEKIFKVQQILDSLKSLRKVVDQYVANKIYDLVSGELTSDVMEWYGLVKTSGDPDVHFDGFDLEYTKTGDAKARRIRIKAKSYGKDLVSAVSSLSDSKLNALGLCLSIATALKSEAQFEFLIIDDPIQSWDDEHEIQFIEVIQKLVGLGKQIILLSHNRRWLNQVRSGCRSMNGWFYEFTGYTEKGPNIIKVPWEQWKQRLDEIDAVLKDQKASSIKLQQAEEEIRIVIPEITCELYFMQKGVNKAPHNLNSDKVRKLLTECTVRTELIDRIVQTFETTDDAHHASEDYVPQRERLRRYYSWVYELANLLK
ncbi:MAG: AAA family ATPase, partial [Actinobacteria bacterium]|nr:AAA family ATPase [Actinomycetota bacterium]